jgi:hypothetical protein
MFNAMLSGKFVHAYAPINFRFLTDRKPVGVYKGELSTTEGFLEVYFVVGVALEHGNMRKFGNSLGFSGVKTSCDAADLVFAILRKI